MESDSDDSMSSFDDWYDRIRFLDDWNPLTRIEDYDLESGGPWKIIQDEECQKIASLSTGELFSYINHVVRTNWWSITVHHSAVYEYDIIFGITGTHAANKYENTMMSIVMKLKNRLEEELQISDDIQNVREVMAGNISISDHTALFCVHKHMVRMRNTARASKIRRYMEKMTYFIQNIEALFRMHHLQVQEMEQRARLEARRRRKRRAPERLIITSTQKKSYL